MENLYKGIYKGKKVLLTGHTGFKGSWLALWLYKMGAEVIGFSKDIPTSPSHWEKLQLPITSIMGDIRDKKMVESVFETYQPEIVFHLAAQALVRYSYQNDLETFETNIMGTANLMHCALNSPSVKAFVNVTSDKAYENKEWAWGYRENEAMGGHDPYSASKGCSELITSSYRNSFFQHTDKLLASVRAGNVIGGGDWALDRLVPDIFKSTQHQEIAQIRNPSATRPWQHVLEPLSGYLLVGQHLLEQNKQVADAWNFGPSEDSTRTVYQLSECITKYWDRVVFHIAKLENQPHEAHLLKLDCSKAAHYLNWKTIWNFEQTIKHTTNWYKKFYINPVVNTLHLSTSDLEAYIQDAKNSNSIWTN